VVKKRLTKFVGKKEDNSIMKLKLVVHFSFAGGRGKKNLHYTGPAPSSNFCCEQKNHPS
jgi:hypothetical protein